MDLDRLRRRMHETIAAGPFQEALVYLQVTRGVAPRGHKFPVGVMPLEFLYVQEFRDPYEEARRVGAAVVTHPDIRWGRRDIKTVQLLPNLMAKQAAKKAGAFEAWLVDEEGYVTEGSSTNAWIVAQDGA